MIVSDLLMDFKEYFLPWLKSALIKIDPDDYWENLIISKLNPKQRINFNNHGRNNIESLDIRQLLLVFDINWQEIKDKSKLDPATRNYIMETLTTAHKYSHLTHRPTFPENLRAIDTIGLLAAELKFPNDFNDKIRKYFDDNASDFGIDQNKEFQNYDDLSNHENPIMSLSELFESHIILKIPDYQRGYSWEKTHVFSLWDDITNLIEGKSHYTGMLTIDRADKDPEFYEKWDDESWLINDKYPYTPYYIVDGQQRITTIMVMIRLLINRINNDDKTKEYQNKYLYIEEKSDRSFLFGYEENTALNHCFKSIMRNLDDNITNDTLYIKRLKNATIQITELIENNLHTPEERFRFFEKIVYDLKFNILVVGDELDVSVMFETMNSRGKPLSKLELLKNRLIFLASSLPNQQEAQELRNRINECWSTIYEYLGKNPLMALKDDEFLLNHTFMFFGHFAQSDRFNLGRLFADVKENNATENGIFVNNNRYHNYNYIRNYVQNLKDSIKIWFHIKFPFFDKSYCYNLQYDNLENEALFEIRTFLSRLNTLNFKPSAVCILALIHRNPRLNDFTYILKLMEKFVFVRKYISTKPAHYKLNSLYRKSHQIFMGDESPNLFSITLTEILIQLNNTCSKEFSTLIDKLMIGDKSGFGDWKGLEYFFKEYEMYLGGTFADVALINHTENIYPKFEQIVPDCWSSIYDRYRQVRKNKILNSLGNLLLVNYTGRIIDCFEDKQIRYHNGNHSEQKVAENNEWTENQILERGIELLEFIKERWDIDLGDRKAKRKILKLEFIDFIEEDFHART